MLWAISAVTTPLALLLYLVMTDRADLFPWNRIETTTYARKILLYLANALPLLFIALAFLLGTHLMMICALAIIIFFYVILYATRVPYFSVAFWQRQQAGGKLLAQILTARINKNVAVQHIVVAAIVALMLLSAINTIMITW